MQNIRDGRPSDKPLFGCLFGHDWDTHQHLFAPDDQPAAGTRLVVIAWKQCPRCGASKLIHILK